MKKAVLIACISLLLAFNASAQNDSLTFVKAKWETKKIAGGVLLKHYWFKNNLFKANQNINILEIDPHKVTIAIGYEKKVLKPTSDFAKATNALAAINGSFFDVKNGGGVDMVKEDGQIINENLPAGQRSEHQRSAIVFYKGIPHIAKWDGTRDWEKYLYGDIIVAGPLLLYNNTMIALDTASSLVKTRHPRTAVAITPKHILLITIDGRNDNAAGVNLFELAKLLKWLKATDGLNMDGGGSTTMWVSNQTGNGVVNYPTDNKKWDHEGERKVANVILIKKK
jgi:exopolysaccharide biosynthesis protein